MTTFTKTQKLYQFLFPNRTPHTESAMNAVILEFYQQAGFAVLTIEDIYQTIAFYDYEPIETVDGARKRLYRQVVGYGLLADAKMKNTDLAEQEAQIVVFYQQQGVGVTSFNELLSYFPCSQICSQHQEQPEQVATVGAHKLF